MMKPDLLIVKHSTSFGPGLVERVLAERNIMYDTVDFSKGEAMPNFTDYRAIAALGGFGSANDPKAEPEIAQIKAVIDQRTAFLGIGLSMQLLVRAAGGQILPVAQKEAGFADANNQPYLVEPTLDGLADPLLNGLTVPMQVFQLHTDGVSPGRNMQILAKSNANPNQIVKVGPNAYGLQPHFELTEPMLRALAEEDPLLQPIGAQKILESFARFRASYTITGLTLFRNWLSLTGIN